MPTIEIIQEGGKFMVGVTDEPPRAKPEQMQPAESLEQCLAMVKEFFGRPEEEGAQGKPMPADDGGQSTPDGTVSDATPAAAGSGMASTMQGGSQDPEQVGRALWDEEKDRAAGRAPAMGV